MLNHMNLFHFKFFYRVYVQAENGFGGIVLSSL